MDQSLALSMFKVILITPEMAQQALNESKGYNPRSISYTNVRQYAADMKAGKWKVRTAAPMARDAEGHFLNGFHRLLAIVASGVAIYSLIMENTTAEEAKSFDIGKNRGQHVSLGVSAKEIAIVNSIRKYSPGCHGRGPVTVFENEKVLRVYRPQLSWLDKITPRTPYNDATTEAVVVRAGHNGVQLDVLQQFIKGLREDNTVDLSFNRRETCRLLRRYLNSTDSNSEKARQERTLKVEYALKKFIADAPMKKLGQVDSAESEWPVTRVLTQI